MDSSIWIHFRLPRVSRTFQYRNICAKTWHFDTFSKPLKHATVRDMLVAPTLTSHISWMLFWYCHAPVNASESVLCVSDDHCIIKNLESSYVVLCGMVINRMLHSPPTQTHIKIHKHACKPANFYHWAMKFCSLSNEELLKTPIYFFLAGGVRKARIGPPLYTPCVRWIYNALLECKR